MFRTGSASLQPNSADQIALSTSPHGSEILRYRDLLHGGAILAGCRPALPQVLDRVHVLDEPAVAMSGLGGLGASCGGGGRLEGEYVYHGAGFVWLDPDVLCKGVGRSVLGSPLCDLKEGFPLALRVLRVLLERAVWRVVQGAVAVLVGVVAVEEVGVFGLGARKEIAVSWLVLGCLVFDRIACWVLAYVG